MTAGRCDASSNPRPGLELVATLALPLGAGSFTTAVDALEAAYGPLVVVPCGTWAALYRRAEATAGGAS